MCEGARPALAYDGSSYTTIAKEGGHERRTHTGSRNARCGTSAKVGKRRKDHHERGNQFRPSGGCSRDRGRPGSVAETSASSWGFPISLCARLQLDMAVSSRSAARSRRYFTAGGGGAPQRYGSPMGHLLGGGTARGSRRLQVQPGQLLPAGKAEKHHSGRRNSILLPVAHAGWPYSAGTCHRYGAAESVDNLRCMGIHGWIIRSC